MGFVARAHGLRGQVVVELLTNRQERVSPGSVLFVADGSGLSVVAAAPNPAAGRDRWLVSFAGVDSREAAERLRGATLFADPLDDPDALWVHELLGCRVVDQHGREVGTVAEVEANPASDLLVLDGGGLVPLRFVTSRAPGSVTVDIPDGLLDL